MWGVGFDVHTNRLIDMTSSDYRKLSALLSAMKDGAREAFADVYSMYEKKVYFLCCKILKSKSDAKKLTIDVFNYAYLQFLNFDDAPKACRKGQGFSACRTLRISWERPCALPPVRVSYRNPETFCKPL